ncbi:hypothetical protein FF1_030761 [Malus domestica]
MILIDIISSPSSIWPVRLTLRTMSTILRSQPPTSPPPSLSGTLSPPPGVTRLPPPPLGGTSSPPPPGGTSLPPPSPLEEEMGILPLVVEPGIPLAIKI